MTPLGRVEAPSSSGPRRPRVWAWIFLLGLVIPSPGSSAPETYSQTLLRALTRYQRPEAIPTPSKAWISRFHGVSPQQVQWDLDEYFQGVFYHQTLEEARRFAPNPEAIRGLSQRFGLPRATVREDLAAGTGSLPPEFLARFRTGLEKLERKGVLASLKRVLAKRTQAPEELTRTQAPKEPASEQPTRAASRILKALGSLPE